VQLFVGIEPVAPSEAVVTIAAEAG